MVFVAVVFAVLGIVCAAAGWQFFHGRWLHMVAGYRSAGQGDGRGSCRRVGFAAAAIAFSAAVALLVQALSFALYAMGTSDAASAAEGVSFLCYAIVAVIMAGAILALNR